MNRGDIWLVSLDPSERREQCGQRPVLIVSPSAFNEATKLPVILPITNGGAFARRIGFAVPLSGIKTTGIVRCDQPRVIDLVARNGRKVDTVPPAVMDEVLAKVAPIFGWNWRSAFGNQIPGRALPVPARCSASR